MTPLPDATTPPIDPAPQRRANPAGDPAKPKRSRLWATVRALLRARVTAGLVLVLPLWITYLLIRFIFELMRDTSLWVVVSYLKSAWGAGILDRWGVSSEQLTAQGLQALHPSAQWGIAIASVLLTVAFLYIIGVLSANFFGRRIVRAGESLLERVPFVKTIYRATKQILETFAGDGGQSFQRVALVPFPSKDVRSVGFVTGRSRDALTGEELCTVFVVTTPNPTSGFVFVLRYCDVIELDWSIEEAIKMVISGGVLLPSAMSMSQTATVLTHK